MSKFIVSVMLAVSLLFVSGCGNLSPRFDPKLRQQIDNQNGKIGDIQTENNGLKNEILKLQQEQSIANSKLDKMQQGFANLQNNTEYNGVQILSGPGGLFVGLFGMFLLAFIAFYYRKTAQQSEKAANMLAERIVEIEDPILEDNVFKAAMYTDVEEKVYSLIKKHQMKRTSSE